MGKTNHENSEKFEVKVEVHQGSVLSPLLFVVVMEALTQDVRKGLPLELLYVVMSINWGSGHVVYVERVLGSILSDVRDAVDGYTSDA